MVLPEPSRTVTYTTRNTVNRLARLELISNPVVIELSKEKEPCTSSSRNLAARNIRISLDKRVAFWKETYDVSEETRGNPYEILWP